MNISYRLSGFFNITLLPIYILLWFEKNDVLLLFVFGTSLFISILYLKGRQRNILLNNTPVILTLFIFLYGIFNPIIEYSLAGFLADATYYSTIIYASCIPSFAIGARLVNDKQSNDYFRYTMYRELRYKHFYSYTLFIILIVCLLYVSNVYYQRGILFNPNVSYTTSRLELFGEISQLRIVVSLLISAIFLFFIYNYKALNKTEFILVVALISYYVLMQLSVGNRKEFIPILAGIGWVFISIKGIRFDMKKFVMILSLLFLFLMLGTVRIYLSSNENRGIEELVEATLTSNEFVYPFYTLVHNVQKHLDDNLVLLYGKSILINPILFLIPRSIYESKPISLANEYVLEIGSIMGYAYSPVTDLFINYGIFGPVVFFIIFGYTISRIQNNSDQRLVFVFFTLIPDFSRSELATFIYQFIIVIMFIYLIPFLIGHRTISNYRFVSLPLKS